MESATNYDYKFSNDITDQNEIITKLENLKEKKNQYKEYLDFLLNYYLILSPNVCQKFGILKTKTEKDIFFDIIQDLIDKFGDKKLNKNKTIASLYDYVKNILESPAYNELKNFELDKFPSRWNLIYNKITKIETETNPELIYYNLSNDLLNNILVNKRPFDIIYFLKEFMSIFIKYSFKDTMLNNTKKFLLLLLCNSEKVDKNYGIRKFLKNLIELNDEKVVEKLIISELNQDEIFDGNLIKIIIKFVGSQLAKSAFTKIFNYQEIPLELEKEIFTDNIRKYIYFLNFASSDNTGRTLKRNALILINPSKNKKILNLINQTLDGLLYEFVNIVVRKAIFIHEHQHLSGCLLYYTQRINKINTPPHNINNRTVIYEKCLNNEKNGRIEKGERGEIFEILSYGKVLKLYTLFDLLFIADETNDNLTIDNYFLKYKKYKEDIKNQRTTLENILKNFPKEQILSDLVNSIYEELLEDKESYKLLSTHTIAYKKEDNFDAKESLELLKISENLVLPEVCPLSRSKQNYREARNYK